MPSTDARTLVTSSLLRVRSNVNLTQENIVIHQSNHNQETVRVLTVKAMLRTGAALEMRLVTDHSKAAHLWGQAMEMLHVMGAMPHAIATKETTEPKKEGVQVEV